jgi:hypothetical protein
MSYLFTGTLLAYLFCVFVLFCTYMRDNEISTNSARSSRNRSFAAINKDSVCVLGNSGKLVCRKFIQGLQSYPLNSSRGGMGRKENIDKDGKVSRSWTLLSIII